VNQTVRRLPGIRFEKQAPPLQEVLPRMDIAGFVGFAASGPIDVPVPVEDASEFAAIFGVDAALGWDARYGEQAYAFLGPAVRAFFRNGGRRCWVVRVADTSQAKTDAFQLPGIAMVGDGGKLQPAVLPARSEGSWADSLRVSASLEPTPVQLRIRSLAHLSFDGFVASSGDLVAGDLVRISFPTGAWTLLVAVQAVEASIASPPASAPPGGPDGQLQAVTVTGEEAWWVRLTTLKAGRHGYLHYLGAHGVMHTAGGVVAEPVPGDEGLVRVSLGSDTTSPPQPEPSSPPQMEYVPPPQPGALVRGVFATRTVWIEVTDVDVDADGRTAVVGTPFQATKRAPAHPPAQAPDAFAERLNLRLAVADDAGASVVLTGLGFAPAHPRFVGLLPSDTDLYADPSSAPVAGTLTADAAQPRFPLARPEQQPSRYVPLGATILPGPGLPAMRPAGLNRLRDGLEQLDASLFLDRALATTDAWRLLEEAFWIEYQQPEPRVLRGIHSLLRVDEVTIVAAPDAAQRNWYLAPGAPIHHPAAPEPAAEPDWAQFLACTTHVPSTPVLEQIGDKEAGAFTLAWSATDVAGATYELQETVSPDDETSPPEALYAGPEREFSVYGRPRESTLYYRVRALARGEASGWSNWIVVRTTQTTRWLLDDPSGYDASETLLPVQLALLRMCAARGDLFAVLALPEHYRERAAIAHVRTLKTSSGRPAGSEPDPIFSYAAVYHPWLFSTDPSNPGAIRRTPPDGTATGVMASRSSRRGPWVAPANEPLRNVVQLDPPLGGDWFQALQDAQVNVVRHEPGGFLWLAADTLSDDDDLRPIGVRRLLQTLRRAALLHGAAYAFEPNSATFRRTVQRGFEKLLSRAFELGAFAGATTTEAYQVNTGSPPNTPETIDSGQLIVELKVAPSRPLTFLTIRLVRTGEGSLQVETR
jgi:hypothetical protein